MPADSDWIDRRLRDRNGEIVGLVVDVYDNPATRQPAWLAVATGFFGTSIGVVPICGASRVGHDIVVPHDRITIDTSPPVSISVAVDSTDHDLLDRHYTTPARPHTAHPVRPDPTSAVQDGESLGIQGIATSQQE